MHFAVLHAVVRKAEHIALKHSRLAAMQAAKHSLDWVIMVFELTCACCETMMVMILQKKTVK